VSFYPFLEFVSNLKILEKSLIHQLYPILNLESNLANQFKTLVQSKRKKGGIAAHSYSSHTQKEGYS